ncbi:MAG: septum formation initiator [Campylobacterales bacterium]|nr:septum formation initiator [Campylobacterales bacterium]
MTPFLLKILFLFMLVLSLGVYVGNLLFGTNSVEVLLNLDYEHEQLLNEIAKYKEENAKLQKEYFELKQLEP